MTVNNDITESSSSYTYKTAPVTAVSGNGTTITYTAVNTFNVGDVIDVTGSDIPGYNITHKTAKVTAISGDGTTITYTAVNTFTVGNKINITGSNVTGYNLTNATVASASDTQFTVTNSATGTNTSSNIVAVTANATVATASATQFTVTNDATGTNTSTNVIAFTASSVTPNIDAVVDLSYTAGGSNFDLTDVAYDVSFNNVPFILKVDNQNPYRRETAQYKKDQFDNSAEPGEQSLTGWWVRSQTSWHNGAGIEFYEPGTDYQHVSHRFYDSRGVDVWNVGELRLLPELFEAYSGDNGINAASGKNGSSDCLVSGDSVGNLKRVTLSGNSLVTGSAFYNGATYPEGHNGTNYSFTSVTTDGSHYYAACKRAIHTGKIDTLSSDEVALCFSTSAVNADATTTFIKYVKGFALFGLDNKLYTLSIVPYGAGRTTSAHGNHTGGTDSLGTNFTTHLNPSWVWNDATASPGPIYVSGNGGNNGEIWKIGFDTTGATITTAMADATMVISLPDGELVNSIHYYLGYLAVGTNKGIRICSIDANENPIMGPLLVELDNSTNGFTEKGSYLYAATSAYNEDKTYTHGVLIRIDLSQQFDDGTFAWAHDLEYRSSVNVADEDPFTASNSQFTEVYTLDDRLVCVVEENGAGELQVEHSTNYRNSGWLQTGKIRYGTVEPKFFKYLQTRGLAASGDSIAVQTIDYAGNEYDIITLDAVSLGQNVGLSQPIGGQEFIAIKYTLNNGSPVTDYPVLQSYQLKSIPGVPRQRMYQYPLSCYDIEMDKYNAQFGYKGRAYDVIQTLEELEITGDFVTVKDYRTDESYQGVIEEVRFTNESSPDKDSNGFGGLLLVTVRKL